MGIFNFDSNTSFVNNGPSYLRPYDIYKVILKKIEKTELNGKDGTKYPVVNIEFESIEDPKGIYSENLFIPTREEDMKRRVNETSGAKYPSASEKFQFTLMQIVEVLNPEGAKKIKEISNKITTFDQFIDLIIKALKGKNNVEAYLKLVGRNVNGSVYAALPNSCVLGKDATEQTVPSPITFINKDRNARGMEFSNYEMTQMKAYKNAAPTTMNTGNTSGAESDDIDLDEIEL